MKALPAGSGLLLLAMLFTSLFSYGRDAFRKEGAPAFFLAPPPGNLLFFNGNFSIFGLHQYSDGASLNSAIKMAVPDGVAFSLKNTPGDGGAVSGQILEGRLDGEKNLAVSVKWMPARQRMALGIPLHPDRMTLADWEALPGIGAKLALMIEKNRQENGEFGAFEELERVRGVGPKRIEAWRRFF